MQLTYEQQAQRIATLERKLAHMMEKEAQLAAQVAELEEQNANLAFDSGDYKALLDKIKMLEDALQQRNVHTCEAIYAPRIA